MGNNAGKESRSSGDRRSSEAAARSPTSSSFPFGFGAGPSEADARLYASRGGRGSRNDLGFFGTGASSSADASADPSGPRRETRQEREARKLEKERRLRAQERDRSVKEEGVDGGYLVTLGTYVGPEDFSKPTVRKLQLERRLAPFWRGLNDHSGEWTEHQLVAAARGLPIPAPDEIPPEEEPEQPSASENTVPIPAATTSASATPIGAIPHNPVFGASASSAPQTGSAPSSLFLGRAKGLASLSSARTASQTEIVRQEVRLPKEPRINGQPLEAYLYKDPGECPICFLYYPPFLNRTRCCDQPICSECFVQIKRPDPHPPEHADPSSGSPPPQPIGEDALLQSEPATCPFCVMPEFGITYDAPPFRRGLVYADQPLPSSPIMPGQNSLPKRRRGQSVSATAPEVVTTDTVRPDWAKKLADARSHAARRSAAATALHTAAYMMDHRGGATFPGLGRRRRTGDSGPSRETINSSQVEQLMAALDVQESSGGSRRPTADMLPNRQSSRGGRPEDIEELMIMEAIRLSLQAEEERKKKEDKEAAKTAKKEEKQRAKDQKKADKAAKKGGYSSSRNNSQFFQSSTSLTAAASPSGASPPGASASAAAPSTPSADDDKGKGKAPPSGMTAIGFNPLAEPTSVVGESSGHSRDESSRSALRMVPEDSSAVEPETPTQPSPGIQQDFNFRSLAEMIDREQAAGQRSS